MKSVDECNEETLDPEDWEDLTRLGHQMIDDMMEWLKGIREFEFQIMPDEIKKKINEPLPLKPQGYEHVYEDFKEQVLPYPLASITPKWWGFVVGTGSPYGMLAEMLSAGMNPNSDHPLISSYYVHEQVIRWIQEMLNYPLDSSGVLVSSGSMANFTGLAVARNAKAKCDMKKHGFQGNSQKMTLYCSTQGHHCLIRSIELLGLGNDALRWIPVNDDYQINVDELENRIAEDKEKGYHPFCIIGNAGTVNTGAFDDFNALSGICHREDMWLHVDGAFGAWVKLSETHRHLADGMEKADSLAVDLHKWMYMPYGIGCTLVRDKNAHYETFVYEAEYLESAKYDECNPMHLSVDLSRYFRSLKAWMLLKADGVEKYHDLIQQNLNQALYLAKLVEYAPELELTAPVSSNIVCFRYISEGLDEGELNALNRKILPQLWFGARLFPSDTTLGNVYTLRACMVNHRSKRRDFDELVQAVIDLGNQFKHS